VDRATGNHRIFASGIRNPNGLAWEPTSGALWTAVNERDEIGSDLVPDYITSVKDGAFYGWPFSYYGQHVDVRVNPQNLDLVAKAIAPDYAIGPHTASLGLTFAEGNSLPAQFKEGAFIGQHGSWNRKPHSGYKVIFVPFAAGKPSGQPVDVLSGFLDKDENALGRPVGVVIDQQEICWWRMMWGTRCGAYRPPSNDQHITNVGAGLLAKAVDQPISILTDPPSSRASPLPHEFQRLRVMRQMLRLQHPLRTQISLLPIRFRQAVQLHRAASGRRMHEAPFPRRRSRHD
jgi:hypothetical protein